MPTTLGIDTAWTMTQPSGVALLASGERLRLMRVARSYDEFNALGDPAPADWSLPVAGGPPDMTRLMEAATQVGKGEPPLVVALDMPLSTQPITGRRTADNRVAQAYSARWAAPHTPTAIRPGPIADTLFSQLTALGYTWLGAESAPTVGGQPVFIETYPHPAIIELMGLTRRLPYKVARRGRYDRELDAKASWSALAAALDSLRAALATRIDGLEAVPSAITLPRRALKGLEDALDALVCAWVAAEFLAGRTLPYGNAHAAIWLPVPR
jgi:predicted RNase H-like nuclease